MTRPRGYTQVTVTVGTSNSTDLRPLPEALPGDVSESLAKIRAQKKRLIDLRKSEQLTEEEFQVQSLELSDQMRLLIAQAHENNPGLFNDGQTYILSREYEAHKSEMRRDSNTM